MATRRLTMAQALVKYLTQQYVERDGQTRPFFGGVFGIFGHGNVAGVGQALQEHPELRYYQSRNEQAMVHAAAGYARMHNRLATLVCTTSVGPGATNMVTAAAGATINRLPVLLLPGDIFARRNVAPVLQQLESSSTQDVSVNDCFRPVSRYWDRISRADQLVTTLPEAMRVLTSPAETGAVTLCLPQDVQAEAYDYPEALFQKRVWHISRPRADRDATLRAAEWIRTAKQPLIVAGGGVIYSEATEALSTFAKQTGIPVVETQAGKGTLHHEHPQSLGAMGVTGTPGANRWAKTADLVIGIGTRYSDFTTASKTAFQHPNVRFININVAELDAFKHSGLALVGDARVTLEELGERIGDYRLTADARATIEAFRKEWSTEVSRLYGVRSGPPLAQSQVLGAVNKLSSSRDVVVCAAGSMPGDLHKLWQTRDPKGYHVEYGYSCMGYEVAGGLGVKMAAPDREVYVLVGDASYLMMAQELVTAVQEGIKLIVVLVDNHGYGSIGALSQALGSEGFGTKTRFRTPDGELSGAPVPVDYVANAQSLGAKVYKATTHAELEAALLAAQKDSRCSVIVTETDPTVRVPGYESWWDVPVAEISTLETVQKARASYEEARKKERSFL
jgi:3D-(3,5/4)-trihydroxycyclohexane-1,2-dione acylhydrolase (decyclizing)